MPIKIRGIGLICILLLSFIGFTQFEYYKKTNTIQYSAFGGWQIAANALYGYAHVNLDSISNVPSRFRALHKVVNNHMEVVQRLIPPLRPDRKVDVYYLWDFDSPLRVFMEQRWHTLDSSANYFKKWASMGPLYADYGRYLILKHPTSFIQNFIWPNLERYYAPPAQFMGKYILGHETIDPVAVKWFKLKTNKVYTRTNSSDIKATKAFTIIIPIINVLFIASALSFFLLAGHKECSSHTRRIILCILSIWIVNTIFSVLAAPIELRYQLFPFLMTVAIVVLFTEFVIQKISATPTPQNLKEQFIHPGAAS